MMLSDRSAHTAWSPLKGHLRRGLLTEAIYDSSRRNGLLTHEGERNNCFSKIQPGGQKYRDKTTLAS